MTSPYTKPAVKSSSVLRLEQLADLLDGEGFELQKAAGVLRCLCHTPLPAGEAEHQIHSLAMVVHAYATTVMVVRRGMVSAVLQILKTCSHTSLQEQLPFGES